MSSYEYTVIPAPARSDKTRGAKTGIDRFAATLGEVLNQMARDGWDYVRAETLPAEERSGLTGRNTVYHNVLVFRRPLAPDTALRAEPEIRATRAPEPTRDPARDPAPIADRPAPAQAQAPTADPAPTGSVRAPFSQPMRAMPKQQQQARGIEPRLTAPPGIAPSIAPGPRLGPATR